MRNFRRLLLPVVVVASTGTAGGQGRPAADSAERALARMRETLAEFHRMAATDLWPGFAADSVPVAVYDGSTTWLIDHPAPPAGFKGVSGIPGAFEMPGRLGALTANTGAMIAGHATATVMADFGRGTPTSWAAVIAHEAFHVFQSTHLPRWVANEADLFTSPYANAAALAGRRLEFDALRRAVGAQSDSAAACWSSIALRERAERFQLIGPSAATYERMTELHEGLAQYVQTRAEGRKPIDLLPAAGFPPDAVRDRGYLSGLAMGVVLDRLEPGWRDALSKADSSATLDGTLAAAVNADHAGGCGFTEGERSAAAVRARADSAARDSLLADAEQRALSRPGWTVRIEAGESPLQLSGFDPLNVSRLSASRVLHSRLLELFERWRRASGARPGRHHRRGGKSSALQRRAGDHGARAWRRTCRA